MTIFRLRTRIPTSWWWDFLLTALMFVAAYRLIPKFAVHICANALGRALRAQVERAS